MKAPTSLLAGEMNWEKWTAIGTLALAAVTTIAVFVALYPVVHDYFHRRRLAKILRGQLLIHLMALIHTFTRRAQPNSGPFGTDPLRGNDADEVTVLERLFTQAGLLTAKESDLLMRLLANLQAARLDVVHPESNRSILQLLKELHSELERTPQRFLRRPCALSPPPWRDK